MSPCSVSGTSSSADLTGEAVDAVLLDEEAAVEEHADRLDRVQRHAFGAREDALAQLVGQAGDEPVEELAHRLLGERRERERRLVRAVAELGMPALELRPGEAEDEDRPRARPLEQVADELDERRVGPLQVLEEERDGRLLGHALEEEPPGAEELLLAARGPSSSPSRCSMRGSTKRRSSSSATNSRDGGDELLGRADARLLALGDARAHPHHLRERPEGDTLAVGEAAPAVPPDELLDAVHVLEVLPAETRLADAGDADDGDEVRALLVGGRVEELLHQPKLAVAPDEGRLEPGRLERAAAAGGHPERAPERDRLGLALELVRRRRPRTRWRPRTRASSPRRRGRSRLGRRLDPRGGVDEVAGDHPLPFGAERDCRLAGEDAGARLRARGRARAIARATRSSAARTARSASSSVATGVPQTAMTASPMNFSTVPP